VSTRRPTPSELVRAQVAIDAHALAPDGSWLVYVRRTVRRGAYRRHLWRISTVGGRPRQLTSGEVNDTSPEISPDGKRIAFLRAGANLAAPDKERLAQAWITNARGGNPVPLGHLPHGVEALRWSPDSRSLALLAPVPEARFLVGDQNSGGEKALAPTARRMIRMDFRNDDGYRDRRFHLWLVAARRGAHARQLTRGDFDVESPSWAPDGRSIAFAADMSPDAVINPQTAIFSVTLGSGGGTVQELARLRGDLVAPAWSPDGRWLAAFGTDVEDPPEALQPEVWVIDGKSGEARSLSADLDLPAGVWVGSHLNRTDEPEGPLWLDETSIVALLTVRGGSIPWRFHLNGGTEPLVERERRVVASGLQAAAGTVVVNAQVDGVASELAVVRRGKPLRVTRNGATWQRRFALPLLGQIQLQGPAGPIQTWVYSPADGRRARGASRPVPPVILDIHGGPTGAWGPGASLDMIALTAAGYRVVRPNIRGSAGFGSEWVDGLGPRWGDVDAADILAVVDGLIQEGLAEEGRLGVMGLSYGGFLVNWLVGVTDRFRAAVSENGVTNQITAWAECHFGIYDTRRAGLGDPLSDEGMFALWSRSPLRNVANVHTPLLMLQAEEDRVCPASDNVQFFAALRALGREVEYVLYPEEHHVMQSIGRPDRRIDRLQRILAWFAGHLR
jgi:dipeptidyl aminopeptidase/acylaminoacyl peptidase